MKPTKPEKPYSEQTAAERLAAMLAKGTLRIEFTDGTVGALFPCRVDPKSRPVRVVCRNCDGAGMIDNGECLDCNGSGKECWLNGY